MPHSPFFTFMAGRFARFSPYVIWLAVILLWALALIMIMRFASVY